MTPDWARKVERQLTLLDQVSHPEDMDVVMRTYGHASTCRDVAASSDAASFTAFGRLGSLSLEMALRIGKFCGNGAEVWLRMQAAYDLWHSQRAMVDDIAAIKTHRAA